MATTSTTTRGTDHERGRIGRLVAAYLIVGLIGAAALVAGQLAGADHAVRMERRAITAKVVPAVHEVVDIVRKGTPWRR